MRRLALVFALGLCLALALLMVLDPGNKDQKQEVVQAAIQPEQIKPKQAALTIGWVGDLTPGSRYGLPGDQGMEQLGTISKILRQADIQTGNLEGTLGSGGADKCGGGGGNCFSFQAPAAWAQGLKRAGFELFNLANNHAYDFGGQGQSQTISALRSQGIAWSGRPGEIKVLQKRGVRVAFVGFAPYAWSASLNDIPEAKALVDRASRQADLVVVMIHAGAEGSDQGHVPPGTESAFGENRGDSRKLSHELIRSGADLVVGSGPHVIRGLEWYRGKLIAYSTGNFAGWHNFGLGGNLSESAILQVRLRADGKTLRARWIPIWIQEPGKPVVDSSRRSLYHANDLSHSDFGKRAALIQADGFIR